ncbi:DinB-like domain-containing protein OS=Lysinibacillus sphaericus OX=1421 GN=LS41612_01850 PE=4 SV=1 [Lysinibacillus sphaericus]
MAHANPAREVDSSRGYWTSNSLGSICIKRTFALFIFKKSATKGPNVEQMNAQAASSSRLQSKAQIVQTLLKCRRLLLQALHDLPDQQWQQSFKIGCSELTLYSYFAGLVEHDQHHFLQVQSVLGEKQWI